SYFIYGIKREKLPNFHLPLGDTEKVKVREIAAEKDLHVADRPDSMDLCFAGEGDYREVLGDKAISKPGPVYDVQGNVMAEHNGIWNYTIGQRRGLGFAAGEPRYVLEIDPQNNSITVGTRNEAYKSEVVAEKANILIPEKYKKSFTPQRMHNYQSR
ncbi:MAG: tRNA methyl transferase PRC-barrel domain-containing protein, partial [Planctomycetota bacterium]